MTKKRLIRREGFEFLIGGFSERSFQFVLDVLPLARGRRRNGWSHPLFVVVAISPPGLLLSTHCMSFLILTSSFLSRFCGSFRLAPFHALGAPVLQALRIGEIGGQGWCI